MMWHRRRVGGEVRWSVHRQLDFRLMASRLNISLALLPLLLAGCGVSDPLYLSLPREKGIGYNVLLQTFHDGAYADQPFRLSVKSDSATEPHEILVADQCKNVSVAITPRAVYVFYDQLSLSSFSNFRSGSNEPVPLLCDLSFSHCRERRDALVRDGLRLSPVCTYQTNR